jgi:hypothetical protein
MSKRALLIGCNYTATPTIQLTGCINDVVNIHNMLIDAYGYQDQNIYMLRDDDKTRLPTKANILAALSNVLNASSSRTDTVWIHYSGHGTQMRDLNGDEPDKLDECIVPCDYDVAGLITDDDLFAILKNAKCQVVVCFDSCNSGTACDLQYSINYNKGLLSSAVNNTRSAPGTNIIMLTGCRDPQTSADAYNSFSKQGCGAFTSALIDTLRANSHNVQLLKLYSDLCAYLAKWGFTQIPVLSSTTNIPTYSFVRAIPSSAGLVPASTTVAGTTKTIMPVFATSQSELKSRMRALMNAN